ncbi:MAG: DUF4276 family protein [Myxococcales bacterium]
MSRVVFLLEERSMKLFLEGLLPRLVPGLEFLCVPHEGKSDLEASIPRKLRAWNEPGARFVVVRDNDGGDCAALKKRLVRLCVDAGRDDALVRIACQELEAWYLGELEAVSEAFHEPALARLGDKTKFRDPDRLGGPASELRRLVPSFQKLSGARLMAAVVSEERNRSGSFHAFLRGVRRLLDAPQEPRHGTV